MQNGIILTLHIIAKCKLHTISFQMAYDVAMCTVDTLNSSNNVFFFSLAARLDLLRQLKYFLKINALNFKFFAVFQPCINVFLLRYQCTESHDCSELELGGLVIRMSLNVKSQGTKNIELCSQGTKAAKI